MWLFFGGLAEIIVDSITMDEEECRRDEELSISARRTESLDGPLISELVSKDTQRLFGRVNVAHIM